ncbi:Uncharacterized protein Fot_10681 [Forsythia ovata]|uniref:Uncharacterized protein n=1 Tax=Forsythia ovata TaxID=205694 RepID=A0ABD1WHI6_9LAMI
MSVAILKHKIDRHRPDFASFHPTSSSPKNNRQQPTFSILSSTIGIHNGTKLKKNPLEKTRPRADHRICVPRPRRSHQTCAMIQRDLHVIAQIRLDLSPQRRSSEIYAADNPIFFLLHWLQLLHRKWAVEWK